MSKKRVIAPSGSCSSRNPRQDPVPQSHRKLDDRPSPVPPAQIDRYDKFDFRLSTAQNSRAEDNPFGEFFAFSGAEADEEMDDHQAFDGFAGRGLVSDSENYNSRMVL